MYVCARVLCFIFTQTVTCREEIFFLSNYYAPALFHILSYWLRNINIHTYMCTHRYIWILNMEMSCLYVCYLFVVVFRVSFLM